MQSHADLTVAFEHRASTFATGVLEEAKRRAHEASVRADARPDASERWKREFLARVRDAPMRVRQLGLVRALGELAARGASVGTPGASVNGFLLAEILSWLGRDSGPFPPRSGSHYVSNDLRVFEDALLADPCWIGHAEVDLQRFLRWLKRLGEASLGEEAAMGPEEVRS